MDHAPDKYANRSVWVTVASSLALGLCVFAGQGFRASGSVVDFLAANSVRHFANSSPNESAVASIEKQTRTQSKTTRRQLQFGALPPNSALILPGACDERLLAEARCQSLTARSLPNDRAPPLPTA